ncbi:NFX1-type zinc finger-containing protein 1 [Colletotrichum fructicola]|nr:NFX1-type zinc finger-containing protein 1 [Colletotrichum fructicola]
MAPTSVQLSIFFIRPLPAVCKHRPVSLWWTLSNRPSDPEREKIHAWKRLRPSPAYSNDGDTASYFRMALDLVEQDASLAQEVIREIASDRRLNLIRDVLEGLSLSKTSAEKASLWESRISPLFRVIIHPAIVDSVVVEQETTTIYRSFLGIDATRLKHLFDFVLHLVDHWSELPFRESGASGLEAISLACGLLAKVIDTSAANIVNSHFTSIVEDIQLRLDVFGNSAEAFYSMQASKYLDYVRRRLGIGRTLPDVAHKNANSGAMAEFILTEDLPGRLSLRGRRHDNDHADIAKIRIMPTLEAIMSFRDEYLPTVNPSQHHLQGLRGLLDRHFRLLREDILHDLRNAIRTRVESNNRVREIRTRIVVYDYATAVETTFDKRGGLEFVVKFDRPKAAKELDKAQRAAWWVQTKRLTDGALVCIVDDIGNVFFCQVSRSTVRTPHNPTQQTQQEDATDSPKYSLPDDNRHAFVHLKLVDTGVDEVKRALLWLKNMGSRQHRQMFEFPSILLPAFSPPLKALQTMSQKVDLPFQTILTLQAGDQPPEIPPPLYSMRPGFSFDLSTLANDGKALSYTPGEPVDPAELSRHSTLDLTQSGAILDSLSRSFALIQGPPGTGKSYTGEALIKVLLANKSKAKLGPIMTEGRALYESIEALESEADYVARNLTTYKYLNTNEKIRAFLAAQHPSQHDELFGPEQSNEDAEDGWEAVRRGRKRAMEVWLHGGLVNKVPSRTMTQLYQTRLSEMSRQERLLLHQDWVRQELDPELKRLSSAHEAYESMRDRNNRVRSSIDLRALQQANIIGVTTTGLAINLDLLRRVNGKVLLCEEAGEVLEAHLLTALLPTIEHAILIGDHLQLRPQIQDWRLQSANPAGKKYSLDVSLFERLANTPKFTFSILDTQRRMHPSISELVRSTLYRSLSDSDAVQEYPPVCGLAKRLFWLHHESPESGRNSDQDSIETSYSNDFEIDMVVGLVSHLLRQGVYKSGEIAVLTPYLGQLNKLRQKLGSAMHIVINDRDMDDLAGLEPPDTNVQDSPKKGAAKSSALQGVRAATVDNFQGEEANVVIISLVRSNNERRCGFLSTSNRINVLLFRAKHGMYIIGNSQTSIHVPMWAKVINLMQQEGNFGNELELQCPRHHENKSMVSHPEHFIQFSPDGGCNLPCDRRLNCGHSCTGPCHSDILHNAFKCLEDCTRPKEHCPSLCGESCPSEQFCHMCASDDIKDTIVDLIMMSDYRSIDLDEEPCVFPDCDVYDISPDGVPVAVKGGSQPFDLSETISVCPNCRGSLRNISRYGRIVRRGLLDESTKKFISWSNSQWQRLSEAFFSAQDALQDTGKGEGAFVFPVQKLEGYNLEGARHEQIAHLLKITGGSRHKAMRRVRNQIVNFLGRVKKDEQPYQRVAHLVWHVNRRRQRDTTSFSFDESAIQMGSYLQAMTLLLRCDLLLVSDFVSLCRNSINSAVKSVKVDVSTYIKDCKELIHIAHIRNYARQEVEGHIFVGMFCSFVTPPSEEPATAAMENGPQPTAGDLSSRSHERMKELGLHHLSVAKELMEKHPSTAVLESEYDTAWRMLHDGIFYSEVSSDEMRSVYQAMSKEFLGTGHWYTCRNGHPFTIGECGMAMEATRCPECGEAVGGRNHQSAEGVRHARDIEALGSGISGMRI